MRRIGKGVLALVWTSVLLLGASRVRADDMAPVPARPVLADGLLGHLLGDWRISGPVRGRMVHNAAEARAVLGGAFVELHIHDPSPRHAYEARVFIGRTASGGLVAHWLDGTGGETSRTLGRGRIDGDVVELDFAYPNGMFRDRLSYDRAADRWRLLIASGPEEKPEVFSDWTFTRAP